MLLLLLLLPLLLLLLLPLGMPLQPCWGDLLLPMTHSDRAAFCHNPKKGAHRMSVYDVVLRPPPHRAAKLNPPPQRRSSVS